MQLTSVLPLQHVTEHLARSWPIYAEAAVLLSIPVAVMLDAPTWATAAIGIAAVAVAISGAVWAVREWRGRRQS